MRGFVPQICFLQHIVEGLLNFRPRTNSLSYWICLFPTPSCHQNLRCSLYSSKNLGNPRYFFLTWDLQGFFSDFENVLIPQNLILPSIISWTPPLQNLKKNLENPRYLFLPGICKVFYQILKCSNTANPDFT